MIADLLRHGATGRPGHLDGRTDHGLSPAGWAAIRAQADGRRWPLIVASPLRRAREAAQALAAEQGAGLRIDPGWAEIDFGLWDGLSRAAIEAEPGGREALAAFHADPRAHPPPGGEAWPAFSARVEGALAALAAAPEPGPVLVIGHAGPMRLALAIACGLPFDRLWALRIACGTRVRLALETTGAGLSGEIVEIAQP